MAYVGNSLQLIADNIKGSFSIFSYATADSISTILGAGYFADAVKRGANIGDQIFVDSSGVSYQVAISSITGIAATAVLMSPSAVSLQSASVTLTSAQILNSFTTPISVVAGVAGKTIFVMGADFEYNHVTTDYTDSGNTICLGYHGENTTGNASLAVAGSWEGYSATNTWGQSANNFPNSGSSITNRVGLGIDFYSSIGDPAGGDSTMTITVLYVAF